MHMIHSQVSARFNMEVDLLSKVERTRTWLTWMLVVCAVLLSSIVLLYAGAISTPPHFMLMASTTSPRAPLHHRQWDIVAEAGDDGSRFKCQTALFRAVRAVRNKKNNRMVLSVADGTNADLAVNMVLSLQRAGSSSANHTLIVVRV